MGMGVLNMDLSVLSLGKVQTFRSIIEDYVLENKEKTALELLKEIDNYISSAMTVYKKRAEKIEKQIEEDGKKVIKRLCPSCGKGYLLPTINYEDLNILSCKKCRYSIIID
jgi:ribosomal protein S27AE